MEIINHYKNEVKKSLKNLEQQGILTEDQIGQNPIENQQQLSVSKPSLIQQCVTDPSSSSPNPYLTPKPSTLPTLSKCIVCHKSSKYRCPQCLISYCSLPHYKSHNLFCSQGFFKRQVENEMKSLKSTKEEREQVREALKEDQEMKGRDGDEESRLSEERLVRLLEVIEECEKEGRELGEEVLKLSEEEKRCFDQFVNRVQQGHPQEGQRDEQKQPYNNKEQSIPSLLLQSPLQPYWTIPDGLDYFFMQQLDIQEFSASSHLDLILYRQILAKKHRQETKDLLQLIRVKPSPLVRLDVVQYLVLWVLVTLGWGGEVKEKGDIFQVVEEVFVKEVAREVGEKGIGENEAGGFLLASMKERIMGIKAQQTRNLLSSWYKANAISSCKLIVKNKFLLIETFLRLLQFFQSVQKDISSAEKVSKKRLNTAIRHVKKIQFLLSYIKEEMKSKSQASNQKKQIEAKSQEDLFRYLYRALIIEENQMLAQDKEESQFKGQKEKIQQLQKHGIVIRQ